MNAVLCGHAPGLLLWSGRDPDFVTMTLYQCRTAAYRLSRLDQKTRAEEYGEADKSSESDHKLLGLLATACTLRPARFVIVFVRVVVQRSHRLSMDGNTLESHCIL